MFLSSQTCFIRDVLGCTVTLIPSPWSGLVPRRGQERRGLSETCEEVEESEQGEKKRDSTSWE